MGCCRWDRLHQLAPQALTDTPFTACKADPGIPFPGQKGTEVDVTCKPSAAKRLSASPSVLRGQGLLMRGMRAGETELSGTEPNTHEPFF